jgi:RNA ligase (TIGR02306 family)
MLLVEKYDPPIPAQLAGVCKGNFPSFIRKTDQERVQNIWNKVKDSKESFEVTIKLDGTSCTYYLKDGVFGVCSRNLELIETEGNTLWKIARKIKVEETLSKYGKNIALQGEMTGEGIQGNPNNIKGQMFSIFDVWDIDNQKYLKPGDRRICIYLLTEIYREWDNVEWYTNAPIIAYDLTLETCKSLDDLLKFANGPEGWPREGLVFKSNDSDLTFKVISNEYLLREK